MNSNVIYIEKGIGLHREIERQGYHLHQVGVDWIADNPVAVQSIIDSYDGVKAAQDEKWEQIKEERARRQALGVSAGGYRFQSDMDSRIKQMGLIIMGPNIPANLLWKTEDNTFAHMTQTLAQQIFFGTALSDQAIFAAAEQHRAAMLASPDPANYDFSGGWPGG